MSFPAASAHPLRRLLDAFVSLPDRIKLPLAVLCALVVHALIVLAVWVWPRLWMLVIAVLLKYGLLPDACTAHYTAAPPPPSSRFRRSA